MAADSDASVRYLEPRLTSRCSRRGPRRFSETGGVRKRPARLSARVRQHTCEGLYRGGQRQPVRMGPLGLTPMRISNARRAAGYRMYWLSVFLVAMVCAPARG